MVEKVWIRCLVLLNRYGLSGWSAAPRPHKGDGEKTGVLHHFHPACRNRPEPCPCTPALATAKRCQEQA